MEPEYDDSYESAPVDPRWEVGVLRRQVRALREANQKLWDENGQLLSQLIRAKDQGTHNMMLGIITAAAGGDTKAILQVQADAAKQRAELMNED